MKNQICGRGLALRALSVTFAVVFVTAALDKITRSAVPEWFLSQFQNTFLARVPFLLESSFVGIALTETVLAFGFVFATLAPENLLRAKVLRLSLLGSVLLFAALCFGQRLTGKYDGAAFLFIQALLSFFALIHVEKTNPGTVS